MEPVNQPVREAPVFERKKAGRVSPKRILFHVFTATLAVLLLYPVIWLFVSSFKESASIFTTSHSLIPDPFILSNYAEGWKGIAGQPFLTFIKNSAIIVGLSTIGAVMSSAVIAYGFARIPFKGKKFLVCVHDGDVNAAS